MRKGSSSLLMTLTTTLSLVSHSMVGPGNLPLISMPCNCVYKKLLNFMSVGIYIKYHKK